jgi:ABC-type sugar transport system permease subunit
MVSMPVDPVDRRGTIVRLGRVAMVQVSLPGELTEERRRGLLLAAAVLVVLSAASYAAVTTADRDLGVLTDVATRFAASLIGAAGILAAVSSWQNSPYSTSRRVTMSGLGILAALTLWYLYLTDGLVRDTVRSVVLAVVISGGLFLAANRWFDATLRDWRRFSVLTGIVAGLALSAVLVGNRAMGLFLGPTGAARDWSWILVPVIAVLCGAWGVALSTVRAQPRKLAVGAVGGALVGVVIGAFFRTGALPALEVGGLLVALVVGAAIGAGIGRLRDRDLAMSAVTGAAFGWLIGAFGIPELGPGTVVEAIIGTAGLGLLVGIRLGLATPETLERRTRIERTARAAIFVAPALVFIAVTLVLPTMQTIWLSLLDARSVEFIGLGQYRAAFANPNFYDISGWAGIFVSSEFLVFAAAMAFGSAIVLLTRRRIDSNSPPRLVVATAASVVLLLVAAIGYLTAGDEAAVVGILSVASIVLIVVAFTALVLYLRANPGNSGVSGGSGLVLGTAAIFLSLALFTNLRGTLFNNLWWVFLVTVVATGVGLAIAALSDGARGETIAKAMIFMPMAISFVGASIIWRFMYIARPPTNEQTGVLNSLWVNLGELANSSSATPIAIVLFVIVAAFAWLSYRGFRAGAINLGWTSAFVALPIAWLGSRFLTGSIGGVTEGPGGQLIADPILFLSGTQQVGPYNNFFIMVPFIWIYTGFAMVIFSAAIKGVPSDLIDASNVDGATRSQAFWRVVVPQIVPTIGVVVTTIIVTVMKVFDMVKVMTNGNFGTQVLANEMWQRAFTERNRGLGSAIAVMLFLSVLPIMYYNIRRMQKEFH